MMTRDTQLLVATVAGLGLLAIGARARQGARQTLPAPARSARGRARARDVDLSAALLSLCALSDSAIEHYRGSFHNKTMWAPLGVSSLMLAASVKDALGPNDRAESDGRAIETAALATGMIGLGFHLYNVAKRPGGVSWLNLFYGAPIGAPVALSLAGLIRLMSRSIAGRARPIGGIPPARLLAGLVSAAILATSAEAALLHFRGAFHNPAMVIPVSAPPAVALLVGRAALAREGLHPWTRKALGLLAAIGVAGSAFHVYGVHRGMGGWRNWSQNLLNGPPIPAPPAFTALALAGLAAVDLIEGHEG
jgi:hypothetical protein